MSGNTIRLANFKRKHPYLLVERQELAAWRASLQAQKGARRLRHRLIDEAGALLDIEPPEPRFDVRHTMLGTSRRYLHAVRVLAAAHLLGSSDPCKADSAYSRAAVRWMLRAAAMTTWNPSHFLDVAEMTHALAVGYDWLFGVLSDAEREAIREAIVRNGLNPHAEGCRAGAWWSVCNHNWNVVCHGGCGIGALALAQEQPDLAEQVLSNALEHYPLAMAAFSPDGACPEGPMYWTYAVTYIAYFCSCLQSALGSDFGVPEVEGFDRAGEFRIHTSGPLGLAFNFADAGGRVFNCAAMFWLARRLNRPDYAAWEWDRWDHGGHLDPAALIWWQEPPPLRPLPLNAFFRGVEVACMRTAWASDATYVGFKGGDNRANHGHLDLGSFVLDADGARWIADLGSDSYRLPGYFGAERWTYFRTSTEGHNVFALDGANQKPDATARIVRFATDDTGARAVCDLSDAYAERAARALRGVRVLSDGGVLVQDEVTARPTPCELCWSVLTEAEVELDHGRAVLRRDGRELAVRVLEPQGVRFEALPAAQEPPENANEGVCRLAIRLKIPQQNPSCRLVVLLGGEGAAPAVRPLSEW